MVLRLLFLAISLIPAIFCLLILLLGKPAFSSELNSVFQEEIASLRDSVNNRANGVFFIEIFDGLFPIPNRYSVTNWENNGGSWIEFTSPVVFGANILEQWSEDPYLAGSIIAGKGTKARLQWLSPRPKVSRVRSETRYGLNIVVLRDESYPAPPKESSGDKNLIVLIYDDDEYLKIVDTNPTLWSALLDLYGNYKSGLK